MVRHIIAKLLKDNKKNHKGSKYKRLIMCREASILIYADFASETMEIRR